jgi:phospholipase C
MRDETEPGRSWDYAVRAGDQISDFWQLSDFENGIYHLRIHGPNGFFREFAGSAKDPMLEVSLVAVRSEANMTGDAELRLTNPDPQGDITIVIDDSTYGGGKRNLKLGPSGRPDSTSTLALDLSKSNCWYDIRVSALEVPLFKRHYAGRIETGREGWSDPLMGEQNIA